MFRNLHNSLNSLEYQCSVYNSLLHLHSNFQDAITPQNIALIINALYFLRTVHTTLMHFIFAINVLNNYGKNAITVSRNKQELKIVVDTAISVRICLH